MLGRSGRQAAGWEAASMVVRCPAFQQSAAAPAGRRRARAAGAAELPCRAEPSRGGGPEATQTSGTRGPGSSTRRRAAVSREVRAPAGAGAFPRGVGAGLDLGPPQLGQGPESTEPIPDGSGWGTVCVFGRGVRGTWGTEMRNIVHFTERDGESENRAGSRGGLH